MNGKQYTSEKRTGPGTENIREQGKEQTGGDDMVNNI